MLLDPQSIEKHDFPTARRGYDPAAVDGHLRALAARVKELTDAVAEHSEQSLATSAGSQVQSILQAAQTTATDLERQAKTDAQTMREQADADAARTREQAIAHARVHVQSVSQATTVLAARVQSLDEEVSSVLERLRAAGDRMAGDLATLDGDLGRLYDAASGQTPIVPEPLGASQAPIAEPGGAPGEPADEPEPAQAQEPLDEPQVENGDLDGARLVALNMALNGESREDAERYLTQHFGLSESGQLLDEVYASIEA